MKARVLRPVITLTTVMGIILAALAVYALLTTGAASADSTFSPRSTLRYCNTLGAGTFAPDPLIAGTCAGGEVLGYGASPNITTTLDIPKGDLNFSNVTTMAPNNQTITPGGTVGTGEKIGGLHSDTTLGTFNGVCQFFIGVDFRFWNVALPDTPLTPRASGNLAYPRAQGSSNRFGRWAVGAEPSIGADNVTDGASGYALGTTLSVANYPQYLLDVFDPDFVPGIGDNADGGANAEPLVPLAVYGGMTKVVGDWIPLYLVQFGAGGPAGTATDLTSLTRTPLAKITQNMGQPQVAVLTDPTASTSPSDITDFCSHLGTTTMLLGTSSPGGVARVTSPADAGSGAGGLTQFYLQYFASLRDVDQDSFENNLDTCPLATNVGDPRVTPLPSQTPPFAGDIDGDGIDDACDTDNGSIGISDQDGDAYKNRLDNCPQVSNGATTGPTPPVTPPPDLFQHESEPNPTATVIAGPAADNGPLTDGIGDLCDTGTISVRQNGSGQFNLATPPALSITLNAGVPNGRYMTLTNVLAKCIGGTDADADGYCSGNLDLFDAAGGANPARHTAWANFPSNTTTPNATSAWPLLRMDTDSDGAKDTAETWYSQCDTAIVGQTRTACSVFPTNTPFTVGADAAHSCAQTTGTGTALNDEGPYDNWGFDFDDNGTVNGQDNLKFSAAFSKTVNLGSVFVIFMGNVGIYRFDVNADGIVNGQDLLALAPVFGKTCAAAGVPAFTQQ